MTSIRFFASAAALILAAILGFAFTGSNVENATTAPTDTFDVAYTAVYDNDVCDCVSCTMDKCDLADCDCHLAVASGCESCDCEGYNMEKCNCIECDCNHAVACVCESCDCKDCVKDDCSCTECECAKAS